MADQTLAQTGPVTAADPQKQDETAKGQSPTPETILPGQMDGHRGVTDKRRRHDQRKDSRLACRDTTTKPRIAMCNFIEGNPYQLLLVQSLETLGCRVSRIPLNTSKSPLELLSRCRDVDVIHFHWIANSYSAGTPRKALSRTAAFIATLLELRRRGTRIVYTMHNLVPHDTRRRRFHLLMARLMIRLSSATIVHSKPALEAAKSSLGKSDKFRVVPHGRYDGYYPNEVSREDARTSLGIPHGKRVALFLGSMRRYKGMQQLLACAKELARRGIIVVIAGDFAGQDSLQKELAARDEFRVHPGFVPTEKVQNFMKSADCQILPYLDSFTSGAALLGLSFRLPIVATDAVAFTELRGLRLCEACDPTDPHSVADAIERVCLWERNDFEKRCDRFLETCGWHEIAKAHIAAYGFD